MPSVEIDAPPSGGEDADVAAETACVALSPSDKAPEAPRFVSLQNSRVEGDNAAVGRPSGVTVRCKGLSCKSTAESFEQVLQPYLHVSLDVSGSLFALVFGGFADVLPARRKSGGFLQFMHKTFSSLFKALRLVPSTNAQQPPSCSSALSGMRQVLFLENADLRFDPGDLGASKARSEQLAPGVRRRQRGGSFLLRMEFLSSCKGSACAYLYVCVCMHAHACTCSCSHGAKRLWQVVAAELS